jgi:hypothetical protein
MSENALLKLMTSHQIGPGSTQPTLPHLVHALGERRYRTNPSPAARPGLPRTNASSADAGCAAAAQASRSRFFLVVAHIKTR